MKKNGQIFLVLLALLCMVNGVEAQTKQSEAIKKRVRQLEADYNAGRAEAFADAFSDKLRDSESKKALITQVNQTHQFYNVTYVIDLEKIDADKKMGYEKGSFTLTLKPKGAGQEIVQTYNFLDIWELESDGKWRITNAIKHLVEEPATEVKSGAISAKLKPFVGKYELSGTISEISASSNETLLLQVPGQPVLELEHDSGDKYVVKKFPSIFIQFNRGDNQKITEFELHQSTGMSVVKRVN